jgi:imidazolonepropionase-like amidohydrolase
MNKFSFSFLNASNSGLLITTLLLFSVCHLCFFALTVSAQKSFAEKTLVIENVSLIDGVNPSVQPNKTVVIVGDRIKAIGEKGKISVPAKAKIISGKGKYLIAGLWDSHVHLSSGKTELPLFLANGVTSVREMGGDLQQVKQLREQVASGQLLGPRIKMAGTFLESERWLKWATDLAKKDGHAELLESLSKRIGLANPEHARETVKKLAAEGVDLIKVRNTHSAETFLALLDEAKKFGLPVAAHAPRMNLITASDGGLKSIEHVDTVAVTRGDLDLKELAQTFAKNGTWYTPTLVVGIKWRLTPKETLSRLLNDVDGKIDERNLYIPQATLEKWKLDFDSQKNEGSFDWAAQTRKGMSEFRTMHEAGVGVLAATDYGAVLTYPGFSLHDELEALVKEGGLTPFEALQSATKNPPYFFNLQNEIGTIEAGKIADLVLLEANPLENISNTKKISAVVLNGRHLSQSDLQRLLETAREEIRKENNSQKQQAKSNSTPDKQASAAQNFSPKDFQSLRWLAGDWRGSEEDGKNPFYERYRFASEDRIEMQSFKDEAMTQPGSDQSVTFLKNGAIYHQVGRAVWIAERFNNNEIVFAPKENASNSFAWKKESTDVWTVKLSFKNREGQTVEKIYQMKRIRN